MSLKRLTAAQLMTEAPIMIEPDQTLRSAARLMTEKHLHCLLVPAEPGRVVGVITSIYINQELCEGEA